MDLLEFGKGKRMDLVSAGCATGDGGVLVVRIRIDVSECAVRGCLVFWLGQASQGNWLKAMREMLEKFSL